MDKAQVASVLEEIAAMMELKGENPFKIRAYQNGARALLASTEDLTALVAENRLTSIKGIGKGLSENIATLVQTGSLPLFDELRKSLHPGLTELVRIQGVGPKKAILLYEKLNIKSLAELEKACRDGRVAALKGFGESTQENILKGIAFHHEHGHQHLLNKAQAAAEPVLAALRQLPGVSQISVCGSLRRHKEVVRDIDILIGVKRKSSVEAIIEAFVKLPGVQQILGQGETKSSVLFEGGMQVDLRVVTDEQYPFALHYFTGSKEHNIAMRQRAIHKKLKLNEYGLFDAKEKSLACKTEEDIFKALALDFIPPELREDGGEIQAAAEHRLPTLLEVSDIRGVFHVHSTWSDGTVELEEMIAEAERMGFDYVGISDHSQVAAYANGLTLDRLKKQGQVIEQLRKRFKIHIFWGSECDILKDGSMDYPDEVLKHFDFVIASVHSFFKMEEKEMTARMIKAVQNKYVTHLGHPTGRLLLRREPYAVTIDSVLKAAADEGVAVEVNALADRLELDWRRIPKAKALGCEFSCNPDAHSKEDLHGFGRAVGIARKGGLEKKDVVNTFSLAAMKTWLGRRRNR